MKKILSAALPVEMLRLTTLVSAVLWLASSPAPAATTQIIGGAPVQAGQFPQVVRLLDATGGFCTATIVGPRMLLTAASCGTKAHFKLGMKDYPVRWFESGYTGNDLAVAVTEEEIQGVAPLSLGGEPFPGKTASLLGFGCARAGEAPDPAGPLRSSEARITDMDFYDFELTSEAWGGAAGGATCGADRGGPVVVRQYGIPTMLGLQTRGNLLNKTYATKLDRPASYLFVESISNSNHLLVCGLNATCDAGIPIRSMKPVLHWSVVGPFPFERKHDLSRYRYGPELAPIDLQARYPIDEDTLAGWQKVDAAAGDAVLDYRVLYPYDERIVYAVTYLYSPVPQEATFFVQSDDGVEVWVNGRKFVSEPVNRGYQHIPVRVHASLRSGTNILLLKVSNEDGAWKSRVMMDSPTELTVTAQP